MIYLYHINYDIIINTSEIKEIDEIFNNWIFFEYISSYYHEKHINWKEIYMILYIFIFWYKKWIDDYLCLIYDNSAIIDVVIKKSIKDEIINSL